MIIGKKTSRGHIFPELHWRELDSNAKEQVYQELKQAGNYFLPTIEYLQKHRVKLGFYEQEKSGGGWTILQNITLAPRIAIDTPYALTLIVHEVLHLQQSFFTRLSIYGELMAWQHQKIAYREIAGREIGEIGEAYSGTKELWEQLAQLSANSREDLARAQKLMKQIAILYRSDCLPLYPLPKEISHFLKHGNLHAALATIYNLITCS